MKTQPRLLQRSILCLGATTRIVSLRNGGRVRFISFSEQDPTRRASRSIRVVHRLFGRAVQPKVSPGGLCCGGILQRGLGEIAPVARPRVHLWDRWPRCRDTIGGSAFASGSAPPKTPCATIGFNGSILGRTGPRPADSGHWTVTGRRQSGPAVSKPRRETTSSTRCGH